MQRPFPTFSLFCMASYYKGGREVQRIQPCTKSPRVQGKNDLQPRHGPKHKKLGNVWQMVRMLDGLDDLKKRKRVWAEVKIWIVVRSLTIRKGAMMLDKDR